MATRSQLAVDDLPLREDAVEGRDLKVRTVQRRAQCFLVQVDRDGAGVVRTFLHTGYFEALGEHDHVVSALKSGRHEREIAGRQLDPLLRILAEAREAVKAVDGSDTDRLLALIGLQGVLEEVGLQ